MASPLLRTAGLLDDETGLHMVTLSRILSNKYGPEYLLWDANSLQEELTDDFGTVGGTTWERIQALRVLHANDLFWTEWEVFEKICAAAVGVPTIFSYVQPPESEDMAIALTVAASFDTHEYSEEVKGYIAAACLNDGLWYLEPPLSIARKDLDTYYARKNIKMDIEGVADLLKKETSYIKSPRNSLEVQVNNVLSVRKALEEYNAQVAKQKELL
jgi:hypothetical protein